VSKEKSDKPNPLKEADSKEPVSKSEVQDPSNLKEKTENQKPQGSDKEKNAHAPISEIKIDQEDEKVRVIREKNEEKTSKTADTDSNSCIKCLIF